MTTRHAYNQSGVSWYIAVSNVSLPDIPGGETGGDGFVYGNIPPNTTIVIEYEQPGDHGEQGPNGGNITLQPAGGNAGSWEWKPGAAPFDEISILHDGSTDGLNLNEPAGGDVQLFGG